VQPVNQLPKIPVQKEQVDIESTKDIQPSEQVQEIQQAQEDQLMED
jgi:hypothetical protein